MTLILREVLTYGPGDYKFRRADYPWLAALRFGMQGGQGGASSNGTPGEAAPFIYQEMPLADLPDALPITVGAGGRGGVFTDPTTGAARVGRKGDDGLVVLELYALEES